VETLSGSTTLLDSFDAATSDCEFREKFSGWVISFIAIYADAVSFLSTSPFWPIRVCFIRRVQPTRCNVSQFLYFCKTLYVFQTGFPSIIRSSKLHVQRQVFVRPIPDAVRAVLSSWWWTEKPSETCRSSYRNKETVKRCIMLVVLCEYTSDARTYEW